MVPTPEEPDSYFLDSEPNPLEETEPEPPPPTDPKNPRFYRSLILLVIGISLALLCI